MHAMLKQLEDALKIENSQVLSNLIQFTYQFNTPRCLEVKKDLITRQSIMVIFDYFEYKEYLKIQILNKRFYFGILPNWINRIKTAKLSIRLSEGRHLLLQQHEDFDFPSQEYLNRLSPQEIQDLRIEGFSKDSNLNRWNVLLSTGDHSKLGGWHN